MPRGLTFRQRIYIFVSLTVTLAIIATGWLTYGIAANAAKENAYNINQDMLDTASKALDEKIEKVKLAILAMKVSAEYRSMFQTKPLSETIDYNAQLSTLQSTFVQLMLVEPWIDSVLLNTPEGEYYLLPQQRQLDYPFVNSVLDRRFQQESETSRETWVEEHEDKLFSGNHPVITYMTEGVTNNVNNTSLTVNLHAGSFKQFLHEKLSLSTGRFILASTDGTEVFRSNNNPDGLLESQAFANALKQDHGGFDFASGNNELFISFIRLNSVNNWVLFSVVPKSMLLQQTKNIQLAIFWIVIGCLLVTFTVTQLIARVLLKPLKNLQALMLKVEQNDLSVRYEGPNKDEITQVGYRFNRMLEEIQRLMERVMNAEEQKRKSEIKALQAQIDPHFLYNTLNTIYWKSQMKQLEDVQEMVLSLSSLFQLGLNKGREITTLEYELRHVEQYLKIQLKCYENLFIYSIVVEDGVDMTHPILKILLQPLVENSILHGFQDRNDGGIIHISVRQDEHKLRLTVEDNGQGMQIDTIRNEETSSLLKGYALSNIVQRLQLEYSDEAEFVISSRPEEGTTISLILPIRSANHQQLP